MASMRITLFGDEAHKVHDMLAQYTSDVELVSDNPDYVFVFGGDGTLMRAEHAFPSVPKLFLRNSQIAKLAPKISNEDILKHFFAQEFSVVEHSKLAVTVDGVERGVALNDVVVHNDNPRYAVRYTVAIDGVTRYEQVIGDGVVCATPLGSTGYYRSITDSYIETGIGLAFNNSTEQTDHVVLGDTSVVRIEIIRGPGFCYVDNQEASFPLTQGSVVTIRKSSECAQIVVLTPFS